MVLPPVPLRRGMRPGTSAHAGYRATTLKETSWRYSHPRIGRYDESLLHRSTAGERGRRKRSSPVATAAPMLLIGSAPASAERPARFVSDARQGQRAASIR